MLSITRRRLLAEHRQIAPKRWGSFSRSSPHGHNTRTECTEIRLVGSILLAATADRGGNDSILHSARRFLVLGTVGYSRSCETFSRYAHAAVH